MIEIRNSHQRKILKKTVLLLIALLAWFLAVIIRLIDLQVIQHARLKTEVIRQSQQEGDITAKRGGIFDRKGTILAVSIPALSVAYLPFEADTSANHEAKIRKLRNALSLTDRDVQKIMARIDKKDAFIWIKRKVSDEEADRIKILNLPGVIFQEENRRFYPLGTLAAHVLGRVDIDDKGLSGVEFKYNERLQGSKGRRLILRDGNKRKYQIEVLKDPDPGKDVTLTIDEIIQHIAERELRKAVEKTQANWGTVIISYPASGEILAMASYPSFDPNVFPVRDPQAEINRAIQQNFEPGSTFKIVTASAAREFGTAELSDIFDCRAGKYTVAGWSIRDHEKMGILTFPDVFIHSSNVGAIQVGSRINKENLCNMIKAFGFGDKTEVGLPGEENGIFHSPAKWGKTSLAALSIGYEISVTAIQILQAMNVIANRGLLIPPRIVADRKAPDSNTAIPAADIRQSTPAKRVLSEKTAVELKEIFERAVSEGTGKESLVNGFTIAGKTGTAQKYDPALRSYASSKHLSTFVGFVPSDNPVLSMIVILDEPKGVSYYGGQVAAPVFREIVGQVLLYLRQAPRIDPKNKAVVTAQLKNQLGR